ncbi:MAG TPA: molybdopterin dinucleotide binding domain-containing protein, partial [Caldimonas sp.]
KVLRVLGNLLGLPGFAFETTDDVRAAALGDPATIAARLAAAPLADDAPLVVLAATTSGALERIAEVPIYATDPIVRRASALQLTADARPPVIGVPSELAAERGIVDGALVRVTSGQGGAVVLPARVDPSLASNVLRVPAGHPLTAALGAPFGPLELALHEAHADVAASSVA